MAGHGGGKLTLGEFREERRKILWKVPRRNKRDTNPMFGLRDEGCPQEKATARKVQEAAPGGPERRVHRG